MKLKRLVLQGYKTFASKTEFAFDEGITAIVGPNGSGKSNIADALRWVLGEQSYSTLRGKRTEDMIFTGSQTRPRAGMAQAILTLDNSDGWLPIDFTEVEIGRRAFRSGENEYLLNGQKVRLKDVTELLATSGLAERTYTIIGQGLVDKALSLRAEERRALFEEAAGINHYKNRRAETLRRLQETQRNLERVHDILSEIRPRLTSLKRQATRARNYEQISADLRHLLRIWYGYKWEQAKRNMRHAREVAVEAEKGWNAGRHKLSVHQEKMHDTRRRINQLQQKVTETQAKRDEVREKLEKARRDVAILQERRDAIQRQFADVEQELPVIEQQRTAAQAEVAAATAELQEAQAVLRQNQTQLQQFNKTFQEQQQKIDHWQQVLQAAQEKRGDMQKRLAQAEGQASQLQERLAEQGAGSEEQEAKQEDEEMAQIEEEIKRLTALVAAAQEQVEDLRRKRKEAQDSRVKLIRELKRLRKTVATEEQQVNQQRNRAARQEERVEMLDQMRHKEIKVNKEVEIVGRFASLVTIPGPYQTALEAALAARLATVLLPDTGNLWKLLNGEQQQGLAAAALDHIHAAPPPQEPQDSAVIGWASELVTYPEAIRPIVQLLLGSVLLVEDTRSAFRLAATLPQGTMAVAPDGFVAHAGGVVETNGRHNKDSILAREEAWRTAKDELAKIKEEMQAAETAVSQQQAVIQEKQRTVDKHQNEERRLGRLEQEANQRLSKVQRNLDRVQQQQAFLIGQRKAQKQEIKRLKERIVAVEEAIAQYRQATTAAEEEIAHAQATLANLPVVEGEQQHQSLRQDIKASETIVAGRQAVVDSRRTTLHQLDKQRDRLQERQAALLQQQEQLALAQEKDTQQRLQAQLEQLDASLRPLHASLDEARREMRKMEEEAAVIQRKIHDLETRYTQTQVRLTQQENQMEGLQERIKADLGLVDLRYDEDQVGPTPLPMIDIVERLPQVKELPEDIETTIHHYRGQLQRMGAINTDAPSEYEETQERYDFLTQQIEDLNQTEARLRETIEELDELTSRAFAETVKRVNAVFGKTFKQLFGGGSAQLILTDPDDLTISGVDILARLPNRREQGLGLLSGGERSLTAAALIFSLLKVSPTPFCVMDEVDAALDEANINRFRELLRELSLKTQFIIITHNRGTVQAAQTLYGISMGTDSASQAISIKPEEYVNGKMAAHEKG